MSAPKYDLKERLLKFVSSVIYLTRKLPQDRVNQVLISQIIRSATSIGANYEEADGSRSKKEFISTMGVVKREAKETRYWLKVIELANNSSLTGDLALVSQENDELIRIVSKIIINSGKSII